MEKLELTLLGNFRARLGPGPAIKFPTRKSRALLGYLALHPGKKQPREMLVDLFWPDRLERQGRNSLSQVITALRKGLDAAGPSLLDIDSDGLIFNQSEAEVDALAFESLIAGGRPDDLVWAESLYQGDLLADSGVREPRFEEWLAFERERLRALQVRALTALLTYRIEQQQWEELFATAQRLLRMEPFQEPAHRALMRYYKENGQLVAAVNQYRACAELLERELGVEPDSETSHLYAELVGRRSTSRTAADPAIDGEPLALPDKPSVAVLPFDNISDDPAQAYLGDGIAEDVVTKLSRFNSLFVIARTSSFIYKGRGIEIRQVGNELGVRYVVEGSIQKAGQRVRITAQLIDATSGNHLWADRFDGGLDDVFDLQDRVTDQIVITVEPEIRRRELERAVRKPPESLDVWQLVQRGLSHFHRMNKSDNDEAVRLFRRAAARDPGFASAHAQLAHAYWASLVSGFTEDRAGRMASTRAAAEIAVLLDANEPLAHFVLGRLLSLAGDAEMAIGEMETAIAINPNFALGHFGLGFAYMNGAGLPEKALPHFDTSLRLNPRDPLRFAPLMLKGSALRFLGRCDEAVAVCRQACQFPNAGFMPHMQLAAALGEAGRVIEARAAFEKAADCLPALSIGFLRDSYSGMSEAYLDSLFDSLRKAGVPE
jgi:TolB-like protein/Flp pilus assembly protein TadD